jgi:hypothetical protein
VQLRPFDRSYRSFMPDRGKTLLGPSDSDQAGHSTPTDLNRRRQTNSAAGFLSVGYGAIA